ncbi:MAG TPA: DUF6265 family protein [Flavobacteriales bacterium]|nr:DUF6265 family protein [Flavobacteriales bacterium]
MRTAFLPIACGLLVACGTPPSPSPAPVEATPAPVPGWDLSLQLVGEWIDSTSRDQFVVHEAWSVQDDSTLKGIGHVLAGADTVFIEALRLAHRKGVLIYSALPGGEKSGTFTDFTCTLVANDSLVFTNATNDFPKRIRYVRTGGGWHAVIDEDKEGPQRTEHFHFTAR